jgi:3-oxoacyl-[acyl-carrier-protein] synthase II
MVLLRRILTPRLLHGDQRVAVTGFSMVTPLGLDVETTWSALMKGSSALESRMLDDKHLVAVAALPEGDLGVSPRVRTVSDRTTVLGASAATMALESAGLSIASSDVNPERMSIMVGTSFGGIGSLVDEDRRTRDGRGRVSPRLITRVIPSALASHLAIEYQVTGPVMTYMGACAASAQALGEAMLAILTGRCDRVLAGGADTLFVDPIMWSLMASGALATLESDESAAEAVRPFDRLRRGMALGEGGAFFILENETLARARGAQIYAFLVGYGTGNDAHHVTAPEPSGLGAERVMRMAIESAGVTSRDIGYVSAHATGTKLGDAAEAAALLRVFDARVPVSSVKGAIGHSLGAAGAIEAALSVQVLRTQMMPANTGIEQPDTGAPSGLLFDPLQIEPGALVLSNSFGFGGHNVSLIFAPGEE